MNNIQPQYRLDDQNKVVRCDDMEEWNRWHETIHEDDRTRMGLIVKQTSVGSAFVSTVFCRIDGAVWEDSPMCFETAVFNQHECESVTRHATWEDAVSVHETIVNGMINA